jgi:hypothetical protein
MKRRGFTHAERVAGGKARARMQRGEHGRFARLLYGSSSRRGRKEVIHIDRAELNRIKAEKNLRRSPSNPVRLAFLRPRSQRAFGKRYKVAVTHSKPKATKRYDPKYRNSGGF